MKEIKIIIKNHRDEVVLVTTNTKYKKDLTDNKDMLEMWWICKIEYDDGNIGYDGVGWDARKVICINGKYIYADYNFSFEGKKNVYDKLIKYFKIKNKNKYLEILEEELNTLFTFIYYNDAAKQQESYERLVKIYEETKGSVLEILTVALMSIAMNTMLYAKDLSILSENTSLLEYFMLN